MYPYGGESDSKQAPGEMRPKDEVKKEAKSFMKQYFASMGRYTFSLLTSTSHNNNFQFTCNLTRIAKTRFSKRLYHISRIIFFLMIFR